LNNESKHGKCRSVVHCTDLARICAAVAVAVAAAAAAATATAAAAAIVDSSAAAACDAGAGAAAAVGIGFLCTRDAARSCTLATVAVSTVEASGSEFLGERSAYMKHCGSRHWGATRGHRWRVVCRRHDRVDIGGHVERLHGGDSGAPRGR
jgi:hypothetical protein